MSETTIADQLGKCCAERLDGSYVRDRAEVTVADVARNAIIGILSDRLEGLLGDAVAKCESPIEEAMLAAMLVVLVNDEFTVEVDGPFFIGASHPAYTRCVIECQRQLGDYRVDFFVTAVGPRYVSGGKVKENDRQCIVVECDGHDFHERTKEQASRDRERDRVLQAAGYPVFRFTGSDIWKNAVACAAEVAAHLSKGRPA